MRSVIFRVKDPSPPESTTLYVTGSCTLLGQWDASKALPLSTDDKLRPEWTSLPVFLSKNDCREKAIGYQYLRKKGNDAVGVISWEPLQSSRTFPRPTGPIIVRDFYGLAGVRQVSPADNNDMKTSYEVSTGRSIKIPRMEGDWEIIPEGDGRGSRRVSEVSVSSRSRESGSSFLLDWCGWLEFID